jgi:hypothetical protein
MTRAAFNILGVVLAFTFTSSFAATNDAQSMASALPAGYKILDTKTGDVNLDGRQDALVVLERSNLKDTDYDVKRPLLIFTRAKNGVLKLTARNDHVALCKSCGGVFGDPYEGMVIKDGFFSVEHYGGSAWRWTNIVTFRYSSKAQRWYLWKIGGDSYHVSEPNKITTRVKTQKEFGMIAFEKFDPDKIKW